MLPCGHRVLPPHLGPGAKHSGPCLATERAFQTCPEKKTDLPGSVQGHHPLAQDTKHGEEAIRNKGSFPRLQSSRIYTNIRYPLSTWVRLRAEHFPSLPNARDAEMLPASWVRRLSLAFILSASLRIPSSSNISQTGWGELRYPQSKFQGGGILRVAHFTCLTLILEIHEHVNMYLRKQVTLSTSICKQCTLCPGDTLKHMSTMTTSFEMPLLWHHSINGHFTRAKWAPIFPGWTSSIFKTSISNGTYKIEVKPNHPE